MGKLRFRENPAVRFFNATRKTTKNVQCSNEPAHKNRN